jgi:galactokinase
MAITADFIMAVAVHPSEEKPRIRIANLNSDKFPTREFEIPEGEIPIDASEHEWTNYFKSGLKGVSELLQKKRGKFTSVGMDIVCDGTVPSGGGLSSSASVVCTSALAVLAANGEEKINKKELCELAIVSERAVGVNSGGYVDRLSCTGTTNRMQHGPGSLGLFSTRLCTLCVIQAQSRVYQHRVPQNRA